ncbi:MAG: PAS domain-containing protein [Campylobacterota bacterium]|nr:PAS domain-containing protein [Campylobacterota bacterium]
MERPPPVDEQYTFKEGVIISETDLNGIITYSNRKFCEIAGYDKSEFVGVNHNIVRHPDMPKAAFKDLWDTIQNGESWTGTVKNLRKDGRYYWVYSYISPIFKDGEITGYTAARKPASAAEIEEAEEEYKKLFQEEY